MAAAFLRLQTITRGAGRSAVAAAAYRHALTVAGPDGTTHHYERRRGVECSFGISPAGKINKACDIAAMWLTAEAAERRKNSVLAREILISLPAEADASGRAILARRFAHALSDRYKTGVTVAIHAPGSEGDHRHHHAHVMMTTREVSSTGDFGAKTRVLDTIQTGSAEIEWMRSHWEVLTNDMLAETGVGADLIDMRSYKRQGVDKIAQVTLGHRATAMERRAQVEARRAGRDYTPVTEKGQANALIAERNEAVRERETLAAETAAEIAAAQAAADRLEADRAAAAKPAADQSLFREMLDQAAAARLAAAQAQAAQAVAIQLAAATQLAADQALAVQAAARIGQPGVAASFESLPAPAPVLAPVLAPALPETATISDDQAVDEWLTQAVLQTDPVQVAALQRMIDAFTLAAARPETVARAADRPSEPVSPFRERLAAAYPVVAAAQAVIAPAVSRPLAPPPPEPVAAQPIAPSRAWSPADIPAELRQLAGRYVTFLRLLRTRYQWTSTYFRPMRQALGEGLAAQIKAWAMPLIETAQGPSPCEPSAPARAELDTIEVYGHPLRDPKALDAALRARGVEPPPPQPVKDTSRGR